MIERGLHYRRRIHWTPEGPVMEEDLRIAERPLLSAGAPVRGGLPLLESAVNGFAQGFAWGLWGILGLLTVSILLGVLL